MSKIIKNLKQFSTANERLEGAHLLCPGCAHSIIVRELMNCTDHNIVVANATGCMEVCTAVYPYTAWDTSWIHIGFENAATSAGAISLTKEVLQKKGRLKDNAKDAKVIAIGGDGATYDIGFQFLSGAFERGHDFTYVCLDNEVYANTGGQRSSSTPQGASTTTTPSGSESYGNKTYKKDLVAIMAAHGSPYVAQVAPNKWKDMVQKFQKAINTKGPTFVNAMSACTTEWRFPSNKTITMSDLATDSLAFPLYEIEDGIYNITYRPRNIIPIRDYLGAQGRFKHLFKGGHEDIIKNWQKQVDIKWEKLQRMEEMTNK